MRFDSFIGPRDLRIARVSIRETRFGDTCAKALKWPATCYVLNSAFGNSGLSAFVIAIGAQVSAIPYQSVTGAEIWRRARQSRT